MKKLTALLLVLPLLLALFACGKAYVPLPNPPLVLGEKYLLDLDYEQAVLQFEQAIKIDPKNPRPYVDNTVVWVANPDRPGDPPAWPKLPGLPSLPPLDNPRPENILPIIFDWYKQNNLLDFLRKLIEALLRQWPDAQWLLDELGKVDKPQPNSQSAVMEVEVPEGVFTEKHIEEMGISKGIDPYALATIFGYSRNEITRIDEYGRNDYFSEDGGLQLYYENGELIFLHLYKLRIPFPIGFKIGMSLDEVSRIIYSENNIFSCLIGRKLVDINSIPYEIKQESTNNQARHVYYNLYSCKEGILWGQIAVQNWGEGTERYNWSSFSSFNITLLTPIYTLYLDFGSGVLGDTSNQDIVKCIRLDLH